MTPDDFLQSRCFYCKRMKARVTPQCCALRQRMEIRMVVVLKKSLPETMSQNAYCASGLCAQGKRNLP